MIAFLPNCGFLSEVSRALAIAQALRSRGVPVAFGSRGGPYTRVIEEAGFDLHALEPACDDATTRQFLEALLTMGSTNRPFYSDAELHAAVAAEAALFRKLGARLVVTGFTLTTYLSSRVAGIPLATDHGGSFVPPVLAHGLCPAPVNPPHAGILRLPPAVQRFISNHAPALVRAPVAQLNRAARTLGVEPLPSLLGLMCGELTLVTELPAVLGLTAQDVEEWRPSWPFKVRSGTTFRCTGPLYARLDVPVPQRVEAFLASPEPVVLVAPTSVSTELLRALVNQVKTTGAKVLVAATLHDVADLQDSRTLVAGILPNHLVMPRVAAAVIMGGQGSVQTAVASATPFVGLPYHGEQELNIAVAERLGMALRLSPRDAATPALGAAVQRLLTQPSFKAAAVVAARHYQGVDGAALAANAIITWLQERGVGFTPPAGTHAATAPTRAALHT